MFLCIYLTPITDCSVGTSSVMKLPLRVKSPCCEEMLAHVLGAIQLCPYGVLPVTVVPKFQQVCLILEHQHADEAILSKVDQCLLKALCTVFVCTTQVRPSCSRVCALCVCHVCAFFPLSYLLPNFIWLHPKPLSIIDVFCRLSKYCCLVWDGGFLSCIFWGMWIFWLSVWNPSSLLLQSVYVELTAPGR